MDTTEKGRRRQRAVFDLLGIYPAATTDQLAELVYAGDYRNARRHLKRLTDEGVLKRLPHPLYRKGPYVYLHAGSERKSAHSQKIIHTLTAVDLHVAVARRLGHVGARAVFELPWAPYLIPDQTIFLGREAVWAVEHHLTGRFLHAADYQRFVEEEAYSLCHWWKAGLRLELLVVTASPFLEHVRRELAAHKAPDLKAQATTLENLVRDPGVYFRK